jgi:hypothetical protein
MKRTTYVILCRVAVFVFELSSCATTDVQRVDAKDVVDL